MSPRLAPGAPVRAWAPQGWAWGLLQLPDHPPQRYGVSGPSTAPVGDIVILPSYGESAEWWFETASDLNREGYTVWVLDGAGQGGSGRYAGVRDLGHIRDFAADIDGLNALIQQVIRPTGERPVVLIASGTAGLTALSAIERGAPVERLILSAPAELSVRSGGISSAAARIGLASLRAAGSTAWSRPGPQSAATARHKTAQNWAVANPDLRMGGPSAGWLGARKRLEASTLAPGALSRVTIPVTVILPGADSTIPCARLPRCMVRPLPARLPYHVEDDRTRATWLSALIGELGTDHAA